MSFLPLSEADVLHARNTSLSGSCGSSGKMSEPRGDGLQESQWQGVALSLDIIYAEQTEEGETLIHDCGLDLFLFVP